MWSGRPGIRFSTGLAYSGGKCSLSNPVEAKNIACVTVPSGQHVSGDVTLNRTDRQSMGRSDEYRTKARHLGEHVVCPLCQRTFVSRYVMREHVKHVHQKLFRHQCEHCGKGFSVRSNYYDHLATHTGIKRNVCTICEKQFTFRQSLKAHMVRVHSA